MSTNKKQTKNKANCGNNSKPLLTRVFLIEKIWLDSMENEIASAKGYKPYGFVNTEEEAISFCNKGKTYTSKDCWAIFEEEKEFRYLSVQYCG